MQSSNRKFPCGVAALVATLVISTVAFGADTPDDQCRAGKLKALGKYAACRQNAEAKFQTDADTARYDATTVKCSDKLAATWSKLEAHASLMQASCGTADLELVQSEMSGVVTRLAELVADARYTDNGDGTVTDEATGLQWERKTGTIGTAIDCGTTGCTNPHHVNNRYQWTTVAGGTAPNGGAFVNFLDKLNGGLGADTCFAGHCDWRLPTASELASLLLEPYPCASHPCIDPIFGPTVAGTSPANNTLAYWSAESWSTTPSKGWYVLFFDGLLSTSDVEGAKQSWNYVRAVRRP